MRGAGLSEVEDRAYGYDGRGDVTSITDAGQGPADGWTYAYDELARVTQGVSAALGTIDYAYDGVGNRLARTVTVGGAVVKTYAYAANANRLLSVTGGGTTRTFGYDAAGNVTSDSEPGGAGARTLAYNAAGRLASVSGSASLEAVYDADGLRVRRTMAGTTTRFAYDLAGELLAEHVGGGAAREYIHVGGLPLALVADPQGQPTTLVYVHADHLGRPHLLSDQGRQWLWKLRAGPFGELEQVSTNGTGGSESRRFPGQYADAETGYAQNWMRDYDPALGRYLQSDPIGLAGGLNTYAYVGGNPVNYVDPESLKSFPIGVPSQDGDWPTGGCVWRCFLNQFGLTSGAAAAVAAGLPLLPKGKAAGAFGAGRRTSVASLAFSKALPQNLGRNIPTGSGKGSAVAGRIAGRAIPFIGWGMLALDAGLILPCVLECPSCEAVVLY